MAFGWRCTDDERYFTLLTFTDYFQGGQKVIIADYGHSQQHVEDDHEINDEPSILPLLHREETARKLWGLWRDALCLILWHPHTHTHTHTHTTSLTTSVKPLQKQASCSWRQFELFTAVSRWFVPIRHEHLQSRHRANTKMSCGIHNNDALKSDYNNKTNLLRTFIRFKTPQTNTHTLHFLPRARRTLAEWIPSGDSAANDTRWTLQYKNNTNPRK